MRVLFDYQCFVNDRVGGISKYFSKIIHHFDNDEDLQVSLECVYSNNIYLEGMGFAKKIKTFYPNLSFKGQRKILKLINKKLVSKEIRKQEFELFHPTYYDPYFLQFIGDRKYVITVHDMIHEIFKMNENFGKQSMLNVKRELMQKAEKVIAVSHSTKKDILSFVNIPEDKISVVYHGVDTPKLFGQNSANTTNRRPYFLFVGRRSGYKNFSFFIKTIAPFLKNLNLDIICIGGGLFTKNESILLKELGIFEKVINLDTVNEIELNNIYKNALALVYPSIYEGFGMPLLEAMAYGCPVLSSQLSSLPEVGGDAVIYFDPYSPDSLTSAVNELMKDNVKRKEMICKGKERSKLFTWEKTAQSVKEIYNSCV